VLTTPVAIYQVYIGDTPSSILSTLAVGSFTAGTMGAVIGWMIG
jgi:hypothetical protein